MPPDEVVEYDDDLILQDMQRCIETYHDDSKYSMLRMGLAPCAPFNVTNNLMIKSAALARSYNKVHMWACVLTGWHAHTRTLTHSHMVIMLHWLLVLSM